MPKLKGIDEIIWDRVLGVDAFDARIRRKEEKRKAKQARKQMPPWYRRFAGARR